MMSLLAWQGTGQSDGFHTHLAGRILCSEKATSVTPSRRVRRRQGIDSDLNQRSWRLCFTSGIILSEGKSKIYHALRH